MSKSVDLSKIISKYLLAPLWSIVVILIDCAAVQAANDNDEWNPFGWRMVTTNDVQGAPLLPPRALTFAGAEKIVIFKAKNKYYCNLRVILLCQIEVYCDLKS